MQEDLWKQIFPVGTEVRFCFFILFFALLVELIMLLMVLFFFFGLQWDQLDKVYGFNWNFSNLEVDVIK
jgi:hypothetical protein